MAQLDRPKPPHYDGVKFYPNPYLTPEEELICWCETSLLAPLDNTAVQRYMEVFRQVFPEKSQLGIWGGAAVSNHAMVSASQFDPAQLTFRDLICHYGTGRVIHIDGRGASKQIQYRFGIQTEIGDFEVQ